MSTTGTSSTSELETQANRAREEVARDVAALRGRSEEVAGQVEEVAEQAGSVMRGSTRVLYALALASLARYALPRPRIWRRRRPMASTVAGTLSGLAAGAAMNAFFAGVGAVERRLAPPQPEKAEGGPPQKPATVKAAEALVGPIPEEQQAAAGSIAHYAMSGATGAIYGLLSSRAPAIRKGRGLAYGALVWGLADEVTIPAFGFGSLRAPIRSHLQGLVAHLVYGVALEGLMGLARRRLKMK